MVKKINNIWTNINRFRRLDLFLWIFNYTTNISPKTILSLREILLLLQLRQQETLLSSRIFSDIKEYSLPFPCKNISHSVHTHTPDKNNNGDN